MVSIRPYQAEDFSALCEIFLRAVKETASHDYSPQQIAAWAQIDEARWRYKLAASQVRVAAINEQPVGFITLVDSYIDLLFVAPEYNRQGIASALLHQWLAPGVKLTVDASITAKPFFERHGFQVVCQQNVESRGAWFINYAMKYEGKI